VFLVALTVVLATAFGVICERRTDAARAAARGALGLMLYALVPFVAFVNFVHLRLSAGADAGLLVAYAGLGASGLAAWAIGRRRLNLARPALGALICVVILVNTGYLGLPMTVALLGSDHLGAAVAYDQVVSGPMLFIVGFAVGAAFGTAASTGGLARARAFITRNPPLIAALAGLVAPAALAPQPLVHAARVVVVGLLPLGFFAVGVNLSAERREDEAPLLERPDARVLVAVALRLIPTTLLLAAVSAAGLAIPTAYLLQAAMPTGVNSLIIGHGYGLDQRLIATAIVWSTVSVLAGGVLIALL
jgi:predicted permease